MSSEAKTESFGLTGMNPAVEKYAKMYCRKTCNITAIVDDILQVVYTSHPKLLPVGTLISAYINEPVSPPLSGEKKVLFLWKEVSYCARFTPIEKMYSLCELFDHSGITAMASFTDFYSMVQDQLCLLEESSLNLKKFAAKMEEKTTPRTKQNNIYIENIKIETDRLNSLLRCISDCVFVMLSDKESRNVLDLFAMIDWIVKEVNEKLAFCEKDIKFLCDTSSYFIYTDQRYAVIAMLNALQNALLYSPINDEPVLSLTKAVEDEQRYLVVQVINQIDAYTVKEPEEEADFAHRRCGLGIPAIRAFAQRAEGKFTFTTSGSKAVLRLLIPEYVPDLDSEFTMESSGFSIYSTGEKNVVELMLEDVIASITKRMK